MGTSDLWSVKSTSNKLGLHLGSQVCMHEQGQFYLWNLYLWNLMVSFCRQYQN